MSEMMTTLKRVMVVIAVFGGGLVLLVGSGKLWWYIGSTPMQFPDYSLDLSLGFPPADSSGDAFPDVVFEAGAAKSVVTPVVPDGWDDVDGDGRWNVLHDRWRDGNRNHGFDAVWLAGGGRSRPAAGVADDLWVRAVVFGYEGCRVALCTVDFYGLMYHDVIDIRNRVRNMSGDSLAAVDHVIVIATGNLTAPDFIGLWGPSETDTGVYRSYLDHVKQVAAETVVRAAGDMAPADVVIPQCGAEQNIATARFIDRGMRRTIAAVVNGRIPSAEGDSLSFLVSAGPSRVVKDAVEQETGGVCLWFGPGVDTTGGVRNHTLRKILRGKPLPVLMVPGKDSPGPDLPCGRKPFRYRRTTTSFAHT